MVDKRIKVIYLAGSGRNGSTLLARLLGQITGFLSIGEATRYLFDNKMVLKDIPCGCGLRVPECEFWKNIISEVSIPDELRAIATTSVRMRNIPSLLMSSNKRHSIDKLQQLIATQTTFFKVLQSKTSSSVIVDASKNPANAYILAMIPDIDLYVIHLVRDSRGYVNSWSISKGYLQAFPFYTTMFWWLSYNFFSEFLRFYSKKYLLLRYEDFVGDPDGMLRSLTDWVGEERADISFVKDFKAEVEVHHLLASNPDKFSNEPLKIRMQQWHLPIVKKFIVTLITFPLLVKYGYILNIRKVLIGS